MEFKLADFDLKHFLASDDLQLLDTSVYSTVMHAAKEVIIKPQFIAVVAPVGSGVSTALADVRSTVKRQVLYCKANVSKSQKAIFRGFLSDCGYGDLTQYFRYSDLPALMKSLCYHLNDAATPKVILIFDGIEAWDRRRISVAYELIKEISKTTGCIVSFTPTFKKALERWSKTNSEIQKMLEAVDEWVYLDPPGEAEMNSICFETGINNFKVIDLIVSKCKNLNQLKTRVNKLRRHVRSVVETDHP